MRNRTETIVPPRPNAAALPPAGGSRRVAGFGTARRVWCCGKGAMTLKTRFDLPVAGPAGQGVPPAEPRPATALRLDEEDLAVAFMIAARPSEAEETLVSGGGDGAPQFSLCATADQAIVAHHRADGEDHEFSTPAAFFSEGDHLTVGYSWNAAGKGGAFIATNVSTGATYEEAIGAALTMDLAAADATDWTF